MGSPRKPRPVADHLWQLVLELEARMEGDDGGEVLLPPEEWLQLVTFARREEEAQEHAQRDRVKRSLERYDKEERNGEACSPVPVNNQNLLRWYEKFPDGTKKGQVCKHCGGDALEHDEDARCPKVPPPRKTASPELPKPSRRTKKFPLGIGLLEQCTKCGKTLGEHDGTKCRQKAAQTAVDEPVVDADDYNGRPKREGGFVQASLDDLSREIDTPADAVTP